MKHCKHKIFEKVVFTIISISIVLLIITIVSVPRAMDVINNLYGK